MSHGPRGGGGGASRVLQRSLVENDVLTGLKVSLEQCNHVVSLSYTLVHYLS